MFYEQRRTIFVLRAVIKERPVGNRSRGLNMSFDVETALEDVTLPKLMSWWEESSSGLTAHELESSLRGLEKQTPPYTWKAPHCSSAPRK